MERKSASELDHLLANGELSGAETDAIFERVLADVARHEPPRVNPRRAWLIVGGLSAAAAALLAFSPLLHKHSEFIARGAAGNGQSLEVRCSQGTLAACPSSSDLVFVVSGSDRSCVLSAYAEPLDGHAERVWYFARESESPRVVAGAATTHVFERAVRLTGTHQPGRYRVHAFLADRALAHDEMLAGAAESVGGVYVRTQSDLLVLER